MVYSCILCICVFMFFRFCRFTFSSALPVIMIFDILAIGESFTFTTPFFYIFICCGIICVFFTCSLTCWTWKYSGMVLQFSGFDRQCAQCISLLYPVRYLTIFVWGSSLMRETEVIVSSQCNKSKAKFMYRGGNREVCNTLYTLLSMYQVPFLNSHQSLYTRLWRTHHLFLCAIVMAHLYIYSKYELLCKYNG